MLTTYHRMPIFIKIVNVLDPHFQGQRFESRTLWSSNMIISQTVTDRINIAIVNTWKVARGLLFGIFTFDLGPFFRSGSRLCTFRLLITRKRRKIGQTRLLPTNKKLPKTFPLTYLYLTLIHSKGQVMYFSIANSRKWWQLRQTLLLPTNRKSHLTLTVLNVKS